MLIGLLLAVLGAFIIGVFCGHVGLPWWVAVLVGSTWGLIAMEIGLKFFK